MKTILLVLGLLLASLAQAQKGEIYADSAGAIRGYDPVAYFTLQLPTKGSDKFTYQWKGATWRFVSAENRDLFARSPEKYAPQYGGYCAYGVAQNYAVSIDPAAWRVVDGKLYLNYSKGVQRDWDKDVPGYVRKADANWPSVLKK
ncbi:MAG TPA: YHS domain-containing (seleno)protein [Burkholderiales bacterium]|nr:YHS domain-containing (seleno)protein [Burkholderiales bacterium]